MQVVKVVDKTKKYVDKNGKERVSVNYYLILDNKKWLAIRPAFGQGYVVLDSIAEVLKNE